MKQELMAFWRSGTVKSNSIRSIELKAAKIERFDGGGLAIIWQSSAAIKPLFVLPIKEGRALEKKIQKVVAGWAEALKDVDDEYAVKLRCLTTPYEGKPQ